MAQGQTGAHFHVSILPGAGIEVCGRNIAARKIGIEVHAEFQISTDIVAEIAVQISGPFRGQLVALAGLAAEAAGLVCNLLEEALPLRKVGEGKVQIGHCPAEREVLVNGPAHVSLNPLGLGTRRIAHIEIQDAVENIGLQVCVFGAIKG